MENNGPPLSENKLLLFNNDMICRVVMQYQVREHVEPSSADHVQTGACVSSTGYFS